jgi:photosystem II stability/assembly factor-like uncharacterized protein
MKNFISFFLCLLTGIQLNGQSISRPFAPDDPEGRRVYEFNLLKDPQTNSIPKLIRERELAFSMTLPVYQSENRSSAATLTFDARGPRNLGGITRALAIDVTNENRMLAGTNSGGIWLTTDGGQSWSIVTPKDDYHGITCIAQDKRPGKTNVWYHGSGDVWCSASGSSGSSFYSGNGLYKSIDNGLTWAKLSSTAPNTPQTFDSNWDVIYKVVTNPVDTVNDVVFAATYGAIYRSLNGGNSWVQALGGLSGNDSYFTNIEVSDQGICYATLSSDGPQGGIWRSVDGINWTKINPPNFPTTFERIVSAVVPSNPNDVYFLGNTPGFGIPDTNFVGTVEWNSLWKYTYLSGDGDSAGGFWQDLSASLPTTGGPFDKFHCQGSYDLVLKVKPSDPNFVIIGGTNLYRSTNGFMDPSTNRFIGGYAEGATLPTVAMYPNHHPDQHELIFLPSNDSIVLSGCDGGVFKTLNIHEPTVNWLSLNDNYFTSMFYTVALDHATPGNEVVIGGAQDNGSWFTNSGSINDPWVTPRGGDGSFCAVADNRTMYYFSIQNGKMMRANCDNNGNILNFARIDPQDGKDYFFINPYALDPADNNMMYLAGGKYLWKNTNLSGIPMINNWDSISTNWVQWPDSVPTTNARVSAIGISKANPAHRVYYGTSSKKVYRIDNANSGTPVPLDITPPNGATGFPGNGFVNCIAVDPLDGDKLIVVFSNYSVYSLYYSENAGSSWSKIGGNLELSSGGSGSAPSIRWCTIVHPPNGGTGYFVGTSVGLYATSWLNGLNTVWTQVGANEIGKVVVPMMDYRPADGRLVVATHAHGIYSTTITDINQIPSGLSENPEAMKARVSIYPNPTSDDFMIDLEEFLLDNANPVFVLYDELGRILAQRHYQIQKIGETRWKVQLINPVNGLYFISISDGKSIVTKPVTVVK